MQGAMPEAAAFLALALPWPVEGGPEYFINIHRRLPVRDATTKQQVIDGSGKPRWMVPGKATTSVAQAINYIQWCETQETADTYVCMSGQVGGELKSDSKGRLYHGAARSLEGAVLLKGIWVDVDVKPGNPAKGYASTEEAVSEFGRIRRAVGLPVPSVCVSSGSGGFHAHWVFAEPVDPPTWARLAHALVAALVENGFRGDTGCTIDAARLLRIPNTWNHKQVDAGTGPRLPVNILAIAGHAYPIETITNALTHWVTAAVLHAPRRAAVGLLPGGMPDIFKGVVADELGAGIEARPVPSIMELTKVCPFVLRSMQTGGQANNNALWLHTCNIALFSKEGRDAFHWMSAGHPTYNVIESEELWIRQQNTKLRKDMGWPSCRAISAAGAPECRGCPHLQEGKSPFNHVETPIPETLVATGPDPAAVAATAVLPAGYSYGPHGIVLHTVADDDGKLRKVPVTLFPMLSPWLQDHPAVFNFTTVIGGTLGQADAYYRQVSVPLGHFHEITPLAKGLAEQHMVVHPNYMTELRSFLVSWSETLRKQRENIVHTAPYGWLHTDGKPAGFIYAKQVWTDTKPKPAANPDPVLEKQYHPQGLLEPWITAAKMVTDQARPEFDAILASAFAAPLVACAGQTGLLMSCYSPESGIGKSTVLRVAQSVWGHPVMGVQSLSDTQNSVIKKLGDLKALPVYWDELKTEIDHRKFVALAFQLAQGKEKSRLSSDTAYREPGTWETIMVSASNDSIVNHITNETKSTSAGMMRVFEFRVRPPTQGRIDVTVAQQIISALSNNYGNAGLVYSKWLGANTTLVFAEVQKLLLEIEKEFRANAEERFWLSLVTVILAGAKFANQLKLTSIDIPNLRRFMYEQFDRQRGERAEAPVDITSAVTLSDHFTAFLNEKRARFTLRTSTIWTQPGRPPANHVTMHVDPNSRFETAHVQVGDDGTIRIVKAKFVEWLREEKLSDRMILQEMRKQTGMNEVRGRLGAGTPYTTQPELVLDFNLQHPWFQSW